MHLVGCSQLEDSFLQEFAISDSELRGGVEDSEAFSFRIGLAPWGGHSKNLDTVIHFGCPMAAVSVSFGFLCQALPGTVAERIEKQKRNKKPGHAPMF